MADNSRPLSITALKLVKTSSKSASSWSNRSSTLSDMRGWILGRWALILKSFPQNLD
jgi:hypothetical protein